MIFFSFLHASHREVTTIPSALLLIKDDGAIDRKISDLLESAEIFR